MLPSGSVSVKNTLSFDIPIKPRVFPYGVELTESNKKQFLIPKGFAHGFLVLSDYAEFCYKVDDFFYPNDECGIAYNDPTINIEWPIPDGMELILSEKDKALKPLK